MTDSRRIRRRTYFTPDEESPPPVFSTPALNGTEHDTRPLIVGRGGTTVFGNFDNPQVPGNNYETRDIETRQALWVTQPQKRCAT